MKQNSILKGLTFAGTLCGLLLTQRTASAQGLGLWDFNQSNLVATAGSALGDLLYADGSSGATASATAFGTAASFGLPLIGGTNAIVMKYAAETDASIGYQMLTPPTGTSGGTFVSEYTLLMDVLYPASANGKFRPLLQTDDGLLDNILAYLAVGADNSLVATCSRASGGPSGTAGQITTNTWYRLAMVVSHAAGQIRFYTNGTLAGSLSGLKAGDAYELYPGSYVRLFGSATETNGAGGYANSVQFRDEALNAGQVRALGAAAAADIPLVIPPVPSFISARKPEVGATAIAPSPTLQVVLDQGSTTIIPGSMTLALDGSVVPASVTGPTLNQYTIEYAVPTILDPLSLHNIALVYQDNGSGWQTNSWSFTVANYQNLFLPATALYTETFDAVPEGGLPTGWVGTNWTDTLNAGLNLNDPLSDSYKDWVAIGVDHYQTVDSGSSSYTDTASYTSPGLPTVSGNRRLMIPPIVLNGQLLTNLVSGNLIVAESDQRGGSQVQVVFTKDYDLTGKTNAYLSFSMLYEQNQDNIGAVEYSINQGAAWLPLLYLLDDGTTDSNGSDVVTNASTGKIDAFATFGTARSDQAHALAFSNYIGAAVSTNLVPYIRPCRNDDPVQQKRIELLRLPAADGQPKVRFRFMQAGTGSWYFDVDNFAIYSINTPVITAQPQSQTVDANTPATLAVTASGNPPLAFQWRFNGQNIPGATNATYSIASASPTNAGQYQVVISNADGPTRSAIANLTVVTTPLITAHPVRTLADVGETVNLVAGSRGGRPLTRTWYVNGAPLANADADTLSLSNAGPATSGLYQLVVTNSYGAVTSSPVQVIVYSGPVTNGLVVHLTFDDTLNDSSGRGNHATYGTSGASADPAPIYTNGLIGRAFVFTTTKDGSKIDYATLGYPADLKFGDSTDFSVSFWVNYTNQTDDLPFISNKNWASSNNRGWGIFSQSNGRFRVNATGPTTANKQDTSATPVIRDGFWHHVLVSFLRSGRVAVYTDGQLSTTTAFQTLGIDTDELSYALNIGQDGTGVYTDGGSAYLINGQIDDLGIWRRALTSAEAAAIYRAGTGGKDLTTALVQARLAVQLVGSQLSFSWTGNATVKLQQSSSLTNPNWTDVPGTLGASSALVPAHGPGVFFRLVR